MKYNSLFIIPMIGLGFFKEVIKMKGYDWHVVHIIILCFKIELYKREKNLN